MGVVSPCGRSLEKGALVVIAGKGHEATQTIGGQQFPFSDQQVIKELVVRVSCG